MFIKIYNTNTCSLDKAYKVYYSLCLIDSLNQSLYILNKLLLGALKSIRALKSALVAYFKGFLSNVSIITLLPKTKDNRYYSVLFINNKPINIANAND